MGTHISRVKSVDLDSWTDEQLQSILSWGNARANKYWEAKLAAGHAPSEAKIENFIRTKYELKRWVMDGPMPDPATLDADGDDDVPLSLVKEKQAIEKKETACKTSVGRSSRPAPEIDLIGGSDPAPPRASSGQPTGKAAPAPPKATTKDSLLGLDFLGESAAPPRPASTPGSATGQPAQSRPDLKQSILSLYASAPKPAQQPQQNNQQNNAFGGMGSPQQSQGSAGGFNDAFSSLSLSNPTSPRPPAADPFASFGGASSSNRATPQASNSNAFGGLSGGSFFDAKPAQPPPQNHQKKPSAGSGFSSFTSPTSPPPQAKPSSSAMDDLFDFSAPVSQTSPPPVPQPAPAPAQSNSVFNLSSPQPKPAAPATSSASAATVGFGSAMSGADVWGGNEWATPAATSPPAMQAQRSPELAKAPTGNDFGWGGSGNSFANTSIVPGASGGFSPAPKVTADEEFGGWASSTGGGQTVTTATTGGASKGGFGGDDDLFSNVWQ